MDIFVNNAPAPVQAPAYTQMQGVPYGYGPQTYGPYHDHHGPGLLLPLLLIGGIVLFKRRRFARYAMNRHAGHQPHAEDFGTEKFAQDMRDKFRKGRERFAHGGALDMARERYAKGEINADEYETLRRNLSSEGRGESDQAANDGDLKI